MKVKILTTLACFALLASSALAQVSLTAVSTPETLDFETYTGSGFTPTPAAGQLDSDSYAITGLSFGTLAFGGTQTSDDFARGASVGTATAGGCYAFDTSATVGGSTSFGIRPGGSDFTPGTVTIRIQNNTGGFLNQIDVAYEIWVRNDQARGNTMNFSWSADDVTYNPVGALDFTSTEVADVAPVAWVKTDRNTSITGLSIANGGFFYIRFSGDDATGSGSRDAFALDNIDITGEIVAGDDPDAILVPAGSYDYGVIARDTTADLALEIQNSGASTNNLDITDITFSGPDAANFSVVGTPFPINGLTPGTTTSVTLRYDPANDNGASHTATATLVSTDPADPDIVLTGASFLDVTDIATFRGGDVTSPTIRITGTVVVVSATDNLNANRHQLVVQDASGSDGQSGVLIDDMPYNLGVDYAIGDQLQNLTGDWGTFGDLIQLVPYGPANMVGTTAPPAPLVLTGLEDFEDIESELIRINSADIATTGTWTANNNYTLAAPVSSITQIRIEDGSGAAGETIPDGSFDVIGIAIHSFTNYQIHPRLDTDIIVNPPSSVPDWTRFD